MELPEPYKPTGTKYYLFKYKEHDKYKLRSTGKRLKFEAREFIKQYFDAIKKRKAGVKFKDFTENFFDMAGPFVRKQLEYGKRFSLSHAKAKTSVLKNHILPIFENKYLHEITKADIENFCIGLKLSNQTRNHALFTLRQIMREAEDQGLVPYSVAERARQFSVKHKTRDIFQPKELDRLFPDDLLSVWEEWKFGCLFAILAYCGLRSGEVRALSWDDYIADRKVLLIRKAFKEMENAIGTTKSGNERLVKLDLFSDRPVNWINDYKETLLHNKDLGNIKLMFPGDDGKPLNGNIIKRRFEAGAQKAGIELNGRTPHCLRHTFVTLIQSLYDDRAVRLLSGHRSEKMTKQYTHLQVDEVLKQIESGKIEHIEFTTKSKKGKEKKFSKSVKK